MAGQIIARRESQTEYREGGRVERCNKPPEWQDMLRTEAMR